jgi:hypothetical protein
VRKVMMKRRKIEKFFNGLILFYVIYDVIEIARDEEGLECIDVYQIFDVTDVWDFSDIDEVFK